MCCAEPVKPESGQNPTTQTKVLLNASKNQPEISSRTNNRQSMLGNILDWFVLGGGCFELMMSTQNNKSGGVPGFIRIEFDGDFLSFRLDALCCAELVKPESGQNPTTQTKVVLDSPKNQPEICSWMNNEQAMLENI